MTRRTYVVVRGVASACGLHPGSKSWQECHHCARAHAANEAALADVVPRSRAADTRLTDEDVSRIQQLHADGMSVHRITLQERKGPDVVKRVLSGQYVTQTIARKRHGERALPVPGQSARSMALVPTQRART